jgi:polar amino acid transport system substrate-binding protein
MNPLISPLKTWGKFRLSVAVGLGLASLSMPAARAQDAGFPVLFDARERLPRPDLSNLVRLRILTTADFPPFNFADQTGRLTGFNIDLAREVCLELKIEAKCQIQALPFEELETALANNAGEAVLAGVAITPERRDRLSFSRPYLTIPARFARNVSRDLSGEGAEALAGRPVGVVKDTAHEAMLKSFFPKVIPVVFDDRDAMLQALRDDKVAAVFSDGLRLPFWLAGEASGKCCVLFGGPYLSNDFLGEGMAVMLRSDEETLRAAFDHALATLSRNGRLQDIYLRYFPYGLY